MSGSNRLFLIGIFLQLIITTLCMPVSSQTSKTDAGEKSGESVKNKWCLDNNGEFCDANGKKIDIVKTIEIEDYTTLSVHDGCLEWVPTAPQNTGSDTEIVTFEKQADGDYNMKTGDKTETKSAFNVGIVMTNMAQRSRSKEHTAMIEMHRNRRDSLIGKRK